MRTEEGRKYNDGDYGAERQYTRYSIRHRKYSPNATIWALLLNFKGSLFAFRVTH